MNGAGLAINLYDDITPLNERIMITSSTDFGEIIYGPYQHAVRDVSLSIANSYTIGPNGLGGVIVQEYPQYYDGIVGVSSYL